ncbi:MAG: bifunctional folylpolyglutamate synthase/dihydrofolate synthase [Deltaproteobacteria bacterium]|nr:bifunctional folylpolyglutamate synthase/dihydrofolate synthase [Deltaproteobacteria bacterium]
MSVLGDATLDRDRAAYADRLSWLYGLESRGMRFELDRMRAALAERGDPQRGMPVVHVAGTNGKGSVCALVERALREAGLRTGLFTSPHLSRYAERVRLDGEPLSDARVVHWLDRLRADASLPRLTFFEYTVLMALEAFREAAPDVVVIEVGLGGRLDATNLVQPRVTAITSIAKDHTRILGESLSQIATEKAGILKAGVPLVLGVREAEIASTIRRRAASLSVPVWQLGEELELDTSAAGLALRAQDHAISELHLGLPGEHQWANAAVAFGILARLREQGHAISDDAIRRGFARARWPGRLEHCPGQPAHLFDCAHNPAGARALGAHLASMPRVGRRVLVFGALGDKDHEGLLAPLDARVDARVYVAPDVQRAVPAESFQRVRPGVVARGVGEALERAAELAGSDGLVVVAGSIFLVAAARAIVLDLPTDPPIAM